MSETTVIKHDPRSYAEWVAAGWDPLTVAEYGPASPESVALVLAAPVDGPDDNDGRSEWLWVRLANGDLLLGVFPHGDTYFETEGDHSA